MGDNIDKSDNTQLLDIPQSDGTVYRLSYWKDMENTFNVRIHHFKPANGRDVQIDYFWKTFSKIPLPIKDSLIKILQCDE